VGGKAPPYLSLKARRGAKALADHSHIGPIRPNNRFCRIFKPALG